MCNTGILMAYFGLMNIVRKFVWISRNNWIELGYLEDLNIDNKLHTITETNTNLDANLRIDENSKSRMWWIVMWHKSRFCGMENNVFSVSIIIQT